MPNVHLGQLSIKVVPMNLANVSPKFWKGYTATGGDRGLAYDIWYLVPEIPSNKAEKQSARYETACLPPSPVHFLAHSLALAQPFIPVVVVVVVDVLVVVIMVLLVVVVEVAIVVHIYL